MMIYIDRPECSATSWSIYCHRDRTQSSSICFVICTIHRSPNLFCKSTNWAANTLFPLVLFHPQFLESPFPVLALRVYFLQRQRTPPPLFILLLYYRLHNRCTFKPGPQQNQTRIKPAIRSKTAKYRFISARNTISSILREILSYINQTSFQPNIKRDLSIWYYSFKTQWQVLGLSESVSILFCRFNADSRVKILRSFCFSVNTSGNLSMSSLRKSFFWPIPNFFK